MEMFRFLVPIFILTSEITAGKVKDGCCQDVMTNLIKYDSKREEFETKLETFTIDNNLENGHKALKEELVNMGHIFHIGKDKPLEAYLVRLIKIVQEETYTKTEELLDDEAVFISQEFRDLYRSIKNKLDEQNKNTAAISKELDRKLDQVSFEKKIKEQEMNSTEISEELGRKLDAIQVNIEEKIKEETNSTVRSAELNIKLDALQVNIEEKIEQETNSTVKSEELNRTLNAIQVNFEKKMEDQGVKFESLAMNLKVKLEEQDKSTSALTDVLKLMTEKLDNIQSDFSKLDQEIKNVTKKQRPSDCSDLFLSGSKSSGVYTIYPLNLSFNVYCDMGYNGGGWTVFVKRRKQTTTVENFNRNWKQYKEGFGNVDNEYWMGNEALYAMTNSRDYTLRIDASTTSYGSVWGEWANFKVHSEDFKYKLSVSGYDSSSTLSDRVVAKDHGSYFSTIDRDNDRSSGNCATKWDGGFWFNDCGYLNPTGPYSKMYISPWSVSDSQYRAATHLQMKIRPKNLLK